MRLNRPLFAQPERSEGREGFEQEAQAHAQLVERLFREHNDELVRFLQARLRSQQEAREVAQEAYVRLLSLDRPEAVSYLRAFLFKTAANLAVDRRRRAVTREESAGLPLFDQLTDVLTPERCLVGEEALRHLQRLIATLPPKCQQAFIMNRFEGRGFAAIAQEMGLSESMVRKYVMRALLHCRAGLDREPESASTGIKDRVT